MLLLPQLPDAWHGHVTDGLLDASALTLLMAPVVWLLAVRPLRELSESRGHLLRRTFAAQEQERARVARELHDGLGQLLTTLLVGLKNVQMAPTLELASARARELRDVAAQAHGEVRRLSRDLRPLVLEELGFPAAL